MVKVTEHQLTIQQSTIIDVYQSLEQSIFKSMVKRLKQGIPDDAASTSDVLRWQISRLSELHALNADTVAEVSKATGVAKPAITRLFKQLGYKYAKDEYKRIGNATGSQLEPQDIDRLMGGYLDQTFRELDNNVNQTLISRNKGGDDSSVTKMYQQIIKETTAQVITGGKTSRRALSDTVYKWRDKGLASGMVDKGGHVWGIDTYARMVIGTTTHRAYQEIRDKAADDYDIDIFLMTSHPASREACATIQGHLVTTGPKDFVTENTHEHVYSLLNWGYGEPAGTFGINCRHQKWAYIPGANTNNQKQYDPDEAKANGDIQQMQRSLERRVRKCKNNLELAQQLGDDDGAQHYQLMIRKNQLALRRLIADNDFLHRDYSREKNYKTS